LNEVNMTRFSVSALIDRPVDMVDEAFMDPANHPIFTADLERMEVVSGGPGVVGSVAELHYAKGAPMRDVLKECVPRERYRSQVSGEGLSAEVETRLRARERSTEVTITWDGRSGSLLGRLLLPLLRPTIRRRAQRDLDRFKELIETYGPHFPADATAA
jgi:hypothetical protein